MTKYDQDYLSKICGECGKSSPEGLYLDLDEPIKQRKWRCKKCNNMNKKCGTRRK